MVFQAASQGTELPVTGRVRADGDQLPLKDAEEGVSVILGSGLGDAEVPFIP